MCGRYSFVVEDALILERFGVRVRTAVYISRYNCAPTQNLAIITNQAPDTLQFFRWGLVPAWMKEPSGKNPIINARAETLTEKPAFKTLFRNRRCLVPATGFYEWTGDKIRTPWHIRLLNGKPFCFAGLWECRKDENGILNSFTIITTQANSLMEKLHHRMPVILRQEDEERWLSPLPEPPADLLQSYPAVEMEAWPVSTRVNSPKFDGPEGILPVQEERS